MSRKDPLRDMEDEVTKGLNKIADRVRKRIERGEQARFYPKTLDDLKAHLVLALRERIKLYDSQAEVAARWDITQAQVSLLTHGKVDRMSVQFLLRLAFQEGILRWMEMRV